MNEFEIEELVLTIYEKYDNGQPYALSERQVRNIAIKLLEYDLEVNDFAKALENVVKMKKEATFFKVCCIRQYNPKWNPYFSISYYIKRVLITMGLLEGEYEPILFSSNLETRLSEVENEMIINNMYTRTR